MSLRFRGGERLQRGRGIGGLLRLAKGLLKPILKSDKEAEDNADEPLIVSDLEKDDDSTGDIKTDNDNVDEDTGDYKCNYTIIFK